MSLEVKINITKGWPNPTILEDSLAPASGTLEQGDVVVVDANNKWVKGVTTVDSTPYIITVDSTDPSTARGAHKAGYVQAPWGAVHGIALANPLEIEVAKYKTDDVYTVGAALSAPAGLIKLAVATEVIIGTVRKVPSSGVSVDGTTGVTYLTFIPENGKRVAA